MTPTAWPFRSITSRPRQLGASSRSNTDMGTLLVLSGGGRRAGRCAVRSAARPCGIRPSWLPPGGWWCCRSAPGSGGRGRLHGVQVLGLLGRQQPDLDQVEGADEAVAEAEAAGTDDRLA